MAKLRNATTDIGKFVQWMGRKCRNHNPLEELGLATAPKARIYKAKDKGNVTMLEGTEDTLLYEAGGRLFAVTVRECDVQEFEGKERIAVGF